MKKLSPHRYHERDPLDGVLRACEFMTLENTQQTLPPQAVILDTVMQFFRSRVTQVFADLQIADAIAAGRATGVNQRFLEACAGIGHLRRR
jgi:hypothetical protein